MKNHHNPKPSVAAERFRFNKRDRKQGERIVQYVVELRRLTEYCDYGTNLEHMLRDRMVCGIQHERIQQRLLNEGDSLALTLQEKYPNTELFLVRIFPHSD